MEQHPVPQNVTGFQFKLIGDITLKQFAYLAVCLILAYLSTKFFLIPSLLRIPTAAFFVLLGIGLAFVPIEERPLDRWLLAFAKSIYSPTQYIWKKQNAPPDILFSAPTVQPQPQSAPHVTPIQVKRDEVRHEYTTSLATPVDKKPKVTAPLPPPPPKVTPPPVKLSPPPPPAPKVDKWTLGAPPPKHPAPLPITPAKTPVTGKRVIFEEKKPEAVQVKTVTDNKAVEKISLDYKAVTDKFNAQLALMQKEVEQGSIAKERFIELQQTLTQLISEKERLNQELIALKQKLSNQPTVQTITPKEYATAPEEIKSTVKMVSPAVASKLGMPSLTTQPNVVTGIIKDSKGNLLPNLIVTVKDKEGIPVRALKTNKLGQFAASTPLTNGVYFIELEDPKKMFDFNRIEVSLTGQVLPPLEVSAISERDVVRQKLTQELFGKNTI